MSRRPAHEIVDHTSEIVLRLRAPTFPDLIAEAGRAFTDLIPPRLRGRADRELREFHLPGEDRPAILVDWLNELVYLAEVERWAPTEIEARDDDASGLRIRARGIRLEAPFVLVKAATLHDLVLGEGDDGIEGEVTLDV